MIKNNKLGGTDWGNEKLLYPDLNDTFDAAYHYSANVGVNQMQSLMLIGYKGDLDSIFNTCEDTSDFETSTNINDETSVLYGTTAGAFTLETYSIPLTNSSTSGFSNWKYTIFEQVQETTMHSDGGSQTDNNDLKDYEKVWFRYNVYGGGSHEGGYIKLTDNSNDIQLLSAIAYSGRADYKKGLYVMYIDWSNSQIFYNHYWYRERSSDDNYSSYIYKSADCGRIDISSLSTNLYLKTDTLNDGDAYLYHIRAEKASPTTTVTSSLSANGGTNYTTGNNLFKDMTSGSVLKAKLTGTIASGEGIEINQHVMKGL